MNISRTAARTALKLRKHSPHILFGAGVIGTIATVVAASRATLKAVEVSKAHKIEIEVQDEALRADHISVNDHKQNVISIWTTTSISYAKLYGPSFVLGVTSIALLTKSHMILTSRNTAVMAAYAAIDKAHKQYRGRVIEELGKEKDREFAHGVEEKSVAGYDETGNGVAKVVRAAPLDAKTAYGRWFEESNRHWSKDPGYNYNFLDNQQKWANLLLKKNGHLFLNEVYDLLGMERNQIGASVGWWYDDPEGDGYVDFGFHSYPDFVNGYERSVFLDFNVDGIILDKL